jgi:hypothetical protein
MDLIAGKNAIWPIRFMFDKPRQYEHTGDEDPGDLLHISDTQK